MKKTIFLTLTLVIGVFTFKSYAQKEPDKLVGFYDTYDEDTKEKNSQIKIFKATNSKYYGKLVWIKDSLENGKPKLDKNNPDKSKRNQKTLGLQLLRGFKYEIKDNEWYGGTIYDPKTGKTYKCVLRFEDDNTLKVKGYIGKEWMGLGRTVRWKKK